MLTKNKTINTETKNDKTTKNNSCHTTTSCTNAYQPPAKSPNQLPAKTDQLQSTTRTQKDLLTTINKKANSSKTRITVNYDAGFPNQLFIRGKGANLSWDKGLPLKNIKADEWIWETSEICTNCEFKILINDCVYENGDNHCITETTLSITPSFY